MKHLLTTENLSLDHIQNIFDKADYFLENILLGKQDVSHRAKGKSVANLFFEPSTRTRSTFELAAKKLGADVINLPMSTSSTTKGETLLDTILTIEAMGIDLAVVRHSEDGVPQFMADHTTDLSILNAGDGRHAHPTQALLDAFTIKRLFNLQKIQDFTHLNIAIIGDVKHSRVARSNIHLLHTLNINNIILIGPEQLVPENLAALSPKIRIERDLNAGLKNTNIIMCLRLQKERMQNNHLNIEDFIVNYGMNSERLKLAQKNAILMHPGPINRDVEISSEVAYSPQSAILAQVRHGVAIRMAIMDLIFRRGT